MRFQLNHTVLLPLFCVFFTSFHLRAQEINWATKVLDFTERYQFDNNFTDFVLGPATLYPGVDYKGTHDPYAEGYILHYENTKRKNTFTVAFEKPINARQIILGGIFNKGSIESIAILQKDGKERRVYTSTETGKIKFKTFATQIPYSTIYGIRIVVDHSKIVDWNIIKGIGVSTASTLIEIKPNLIEDTTHKHQKEVVGDNINSEDCFEFAPKIAPDGKTLYFVKECENQPDQDIWYAETDSAGKWQQAKNIGVPLNNKGHNFVASISPDGRTLVIGNRYNSDGTDGGDGVSVSHKDEDGKWTMPVPIDIPKYKNLNEHANFFMSSEGDYLLMAIQDEKSFGDLDLYVSFYNKTSNKWSEPINLGPDINTPQAEDYPYLAFDGKTLYFSSKGQVGYGGHDIYVVTRLDNTWRKWTKPKNLGPFINTKADDKGFVIANEGKFAFFNSASFDSDMHHMDIYKVDLPKILHQTPRILITGTVSDAKTNQGLRASITAFDGDKEVAFCATNPKTGKYVMSLPAGKNYNLHTESIEYFKSIEPLNLTDTNLTIQREKNIKMKQYMETGDVIALNNIQFEYNSAIISEDSYSILKEIVGILKQQSNTKFLITGHTDNVGSQQYNQQLSENRAKSIYQYLVSYGINQLRLSYEGKGEAEPVADNETEHGRMLNRRVEFKITEKLPEKSKPKTKGLRKS